MKRQFLSLASLLFVASMAQAQAPAAKPAEAPAEQKVTIYGFVRNDIYYNTRRNLDLRDGVLDVYPLDATNLPTRAGTTLTPNPNSDANDMPQLGYSAIVTRLGVRFGGITAFGAKASGAIETDFFGITNGVGSGAGTENLLRLRHAYVALDWTKNQVMIGQYWNPNFIPKCFPGTAGFSTGIPFNPFSFVPQLRGTHKFNDKLSAMGMLFAYDLAGFSPAGAFPAGTGVDAQKFSGVPSFAAQLTYENKTFLAGVGLEANTLRPRLTDTQDASGIWGGTTGTVAQKNITTNLSAMNFLAYAKLTGKKATLKLHTTYGQAYTQYVGIGGLAEYRDVTNKGAWTYVAQNQLNLWGELISTASKKYQPAIFVGYLQNLGLSDAINRANISGSTLAFYGRGISTSRAIDNMLRITPRLDIYSGKMKISFEYELSTMRWADTDATVPDAAGALPSTISFKAGTGSLARIFDATNSRIGLLAVYNF